jgi:multicomponent K+:H+ antiporter subunit D
VNVVNHWIVMPVIVPALTAALLVLAVRFNIAAQRGISVAAVALMLAIAIGLYALAADGEVRPYFLGAWPAPFGIILVLDRLAATMLLLTALLSLGVVLYAINDWDRRGRQFHALFQFQLLGVNGAFLTGDVFNLFVFFEVMLIASYGLMLHGGGERRLKAGFHYVSINLVGSTVFLFAVGLIYAVTGTLNMADLAVKVPQVAEANHALLATGALLLFAVFAIKSAMVPLQWWLPPTYAAASAPSAALFAIMTKVGAYSILRVYTLVFGAEAGALADIAAPWILPAALVTLAFGTIGVLASRGLLDLVCYALIASMGTMLIAVGMFNPVGLGAALYYLLHSTVATAALFLLAGCIAEARGAAADRLTPAQALPRDMLAGGLFLLLAMGMVGLPPLSGFIGKLLILDAGRAGPQFVIIWAMILGTSLLMMIGFARAGSVLFWNTTAAPAAAPTPRHLTALPLVVVAGLMSVTVVLSVLAGPVMADMNATAEQLLEPGRYVRAVLGTIATARLGGL